jgi:hypothetical protein
MAHRTGGRTCLEIMTVPNTSLDTGDAAELAEMLQLLDDWLATDPGGLGALLGRFVGRSRGHRGGPLSADRAGKRGPGHRHVQAALGICPPSSTAPAATAMEVSPRQHSGTSSSDLRSERTTRTPPRLPSWQASSTSWNLPAHGPRGR